MFYLTSSPSQSAPGQADGKMAATREKGTREKDEFIAMADSDDEG